MDLTLKGGEKLLQKLDEISQRVASGEVLKVGFLEGSMHSVKGEKGEPIPNAQIAAWQEFGTSRIPARPFFRNAIAEKSERWAKVLGKAVVATEYDIKTALEMTGEVIQSDIQQSITETNSPPLAPSTVKKKGFDKPLIDTGEMQRAVAYRVDGAE